VEAPGQLPSLPPPLKSGPGSRTESTENPHICNTLPTDVVAAIKPTVHLPSTVRTCLVASSWRGRPQTLRVMGIAINGNK